MQQSQDEFLDVWFKLTEYRGYVGLLDRSVMADIDCIRIM